MMIQTRLLKIFFLLLTLPNVTVLAAEDMLDQLNYPELQVTPLASQTLASEAKLEKSNKWKVHWAIQASAIATLMAGINAKGDVDYNSGMSGTERTDAEKANEDSTKVGTLIGAGWLTTTVALSVMYKPYYSGYRLIKKMPKSSKREKLTRERRAEEVINSADSFGQKLTWLSFATNFIANAYIVGNTGKDGQVMAGLGMLLSATPLLFKYKWSTTAHNHRRYKKKIYSPIASTTLFPTRYGWTPGISLKLTF